MFLELTRALSFFLTILTLFWATAGAFFVPGAALEDRLDTALLRAALAACVSFLSGLLFSWPSRALHSSEEFRLPRQRLASTLPVQLFFWTLAGLAVVFVSSWYLATYPCSIDISHDCNL